MKFNVLYNNSFLKVENVKIFKQFPQIMLYVMVRKETCYMS